MLGFIFKGFGVLLLLVSIISSGIYVYFANQTGIPASNHPFFVKINKRPLVIAHRGGTGIFPENTLYAFENSWKLGVDILELDIHETADGKLVVIHDKTVDRTTDGEGNIREKTLEEIKKLNAGYKFSKDGGQTFPLREQKITIPTLEEVFKALPDARFNIEMKPESPTIADSLCKLIRSHNLSEKVIVASVSQSNLNDFRQKCSEVATSASASEVLKYFTYYKMGSGENYAPQMASIQTLRRLFGLQVVSKEFVEISHKLNLQVHVWTINKEEDMQQLLEIGVDGIMTDYPDKLLEVKNKMQFEKLKNVQ